MVTDTVKKVGCSIIQYGKENNRIYLLKLSKKDFPGILEYMNNLAFSEGYSKIVAKIPETFQSQFTKDGYECEAKIKSFFKNKENAVFMCKYLAESRKDFSNVIDADLIRKFCLDKSAITPILPHDKDYSIRLLGKENISQITEVFANVFETYPFPIFDNNYIHKTMDENIEYFGVFDDNKLVAVSSSEMDEENMNSEMTDFAVLPNYRGKNFSYFLLNEMEIVAKNKGIRTLYTIARCQNTGINMTFSKAGYAYGGKLINNTNICGKIETMNVWYKNL